MSLKGPQKSLKKWTRQQWGTKVAIHQRRVQMLRENVISLKLHLKLCLLLNMQLVLQRKEKIQQQVNNILSSLKQQLKRLQGFGGRNG